MRALAEKQAGEVNDNTLNRPEVEQKIVHIHIYNHTHIYMYNIIEYTIYIHVYIYICILMEIVTSNYFSEQVCDEETGDPSTISWSEFVQHSGTSGPKPNRGGSNMSHHRDRVTSQATATCRPHADLKFYPLNGFSGMPFRPT